MTSGVMRRGSFPDGEEEKGRSDLIGFGSCVRSHENVLYVHKREREREERELKREKILEADGRCITLLLLERVARTLSCEFKLLMGRMRCYVCLAARFCGLIMEGVNVTSD